MTPREKKAFENNNSNAPLKNKHDLKRKKKMKCVYYGQIYKDVSSLLINPHKTGHI